MSIQLFFTQRGSSYSRLSYQRAQANLSFPFASPSVGAPAPHAILSDILDCQNLPPTPSLLSSPPHKLINLFLNGAFSLVWEGKKSKYFTLISEWLDTSPSELSKRCLVLIQSLLGELRLFGADIQAQREQSDAYSSLLLSVGKTD